MKTVQLIACVSLLSGAAVGCNFDTGSEVAPFSAPAAGAPSVESMKPAEAGGAGAAAAGAGAPAPQSMTTSATEAQSGSVSGEPVRGTAVAISPDDSLAIAVNRDVGSVSVLSLSYDKQAVKDLQLIKEVSVGSGSEPYQVAFAPDGKSAYIVLRREQQLVKLGTLGSSPSIVAKVAVGSEPTAVAISADGRYAYVANWNDGTVSEIETESMKRSRTIDLNPALVKTGYLGSLQPRAALAHPRSVAIGSERRMPTRCSRTSTRWRSTCCPSMNRASTPRSRTSGRAADPSVRRASDWYAGRWQKAGGPLSL